ncbi:exonuclease domain-containing protein [Paenarthrobacter nicotinovorans]|uniref:exonuclease domain-containing protein n=1 Tax=Paenarthrobacter nicotinovorans TaxID=29320 RepID=UPI00381BE57A
MTRTSTEPITDTPFHHLPLVGFDLETTGTDVFEDRIVTCSLVYKQDASTQSTRKSWLINPGIEIPEEASKVHGVTTDVVIAHGDAPVDALREIRHHLTGALMQGAALVAFNAAFDLTLLTHELLRHDIDPLPDGFSVIDPFVIDKQTDKFRRGSRKLVDVAAHYGVTLDNAHDAEADVIAAMKTALRMPLAFPELAVPASKLHQWQIKWRAEQCASLQEYFRKKDPTAVVNGEWPIQTSPETKAA